MKTADQIEEMNAAKTGVKSPTKRLWPNGCDPAEIGKPYQFKLGNPGGPGRPKRDIAAEIARMALDSCPEEIAKAFIKQLLAGNAYTFKELAERGYGKLKEFKEVTHKYEETPDADLDKRCRELLCDLGLEREIDEIGRTQGTEGRAEKTNGKAQTTDILS